MRLRAAHVLIGIGVLLGLVCLALVGVSIRSNRLRTERMILSRQAMAVVDEALAAAPAGTIEVRARNSVQKQRGRMTWFQAEFVLDASPAAAERLRTRVGDLARPLGLHIVSGGRREEDGRALLLWSVHENGEPLVQVLTRLTEPAPPVSEGTPAGEAFGTGAAQPADPRAPGAPPALARAAMAPRRLVIRPCPPQVAIIIDDVGYVWYTAQAFLEFDRPLTLAVFPNLEHSTRIARMARTRGREIMVHMPMESTSTRLNPGTLRTDMSEAELQFHWEAALRTVPGAVGLNNHQGSVMTADAAAMERLLRHVHDARLFFVDSRTTADTVARATAEHLGVPASENDLFLDNVKDVEYIKQKCRDLLALSLVQGEAIGIAHAHTATLQALQEVLPEFDAAGVQLVYVSALVN